MRARAALLALLSPTTVPIDDLIRLTKLPPAQVASVLLDLELEGALVRSLGSQVALGWGQPFWFGHLQYGREIHLRFEHISGQALGRSPPLCGLQAA